LNSPAQFLGATFDPVLDGSRLARQLGRVKALMADGRWRTLSAIAAACHGTEPAVSARLRDLRRQGWTVERRRTPIAGLWEYRAIFKGDGQDVAQRRKGRTAAALRPADSACPHCSGSGWISIEKHGVEGALRCVCTGAAKSWPS
jgi:hypothetical protein